MITRDDIRELANFHSPEACAVTFYYQPATPLNKSHREESILVKDLVRNALREAEKKGRNGCARADLDRISGMVEPLRGNGGKAKAIFACSQQGFWREFDVPAQLLKTNLLLNQRFHLKPLAAVLDGVQRACVVLVDRTKARVFEIVNDDIVEKQDFVNELTRRGKSDGWGGYDGGHAERRQMNEAMQHFKTVADYIEQYFERGDCDRLADRLPRRCLVRDSIRNCTPMPRQRLVGHFRIDPKAATSEQVKQMALRAAGGIRSRREAGADPRGDWRSASQRAWRDRLAARAALAGNRRGADAAAGLELPWRRE